MSPEFEELVGADLEGAERARLERVHDLLVAAGPPPEYVDVAAQPVVLRPRRRWGPVLALAAALAVAALALGGALVKGSDDSIDPVAMRGTSAAAGASASISIHDLDAAGNWPMTLTVDRLGPAAGDRPYELWLTRGGKLEALCGSFLTNERGFASVPMNAPYRFDQFDGWVVVQEGSTTPLLST
jgi:hypothetical protein